MAQDAFICGCNYEDDFSDPAECEECEEDGVDNCSVVVCRTRVDSFTVADCDATDDASGQLTAFSLFTGSLGYRFFSKPDTVLPTTDVSVDEDGVKTINETIVGEGKTGVKEYCWMEGNLNKEMIRFELDNCGLVRAYGLYGGFKLTQFVETAGQPNNQTRGISYTFSNTKKKTFRFVNVTALGFADGAAFLSSLLS